MARKSKHGSNGRWAVYAAWVARGRTVAETAAHFGVSKQAVYKAIAAQVAKAEGAVTR